MKNSNYRFSLGRMTAVCPACHRRTFKPYVDNVSGHPIASEVGRCNRENNCAYHLSPRQYFRDHALPGETVTGDERLEAWQRPEPRKPSFIDMTVRDRGLRLYYADRLYRFLERRFGTEATRAAFTRYAVGTASYNGSSTVFWLIDRDNRVRSGKVMTYDEQTGRRVKPSSARGGRSPIVFAHTLLGLKDFNYVGCLFGEHLAAAFAERPVVMVESEKTALILECCQCSEGKRDYAFVATGGASGLTVRDEMMDDPSYRLNFIRGRRLILVPDADMVGQWQQAAMKLMPYARSVKVIDVTKPPFSLTGSDDIGDYALRMQARPTG